MIAPTRPGNFLYTPEMPDAVPAPLQVVEYKGALFAVLPDDDEIELHPVGDLSGAWAILP